MQNILYIAVFTAIAFLLNKQIRNYFKFVLALTIILAISAFVFEITLLTDGFIGLALFFIVMYAGALPKHWKLTKRLRSIRKEYSILGFILIITHGLTYIIDFFQGTQDVTLWGILAVVVMIPLFITSFSSIKKKIGTVNWNKLHKFSYLAYLLIFIHLIIVGKTEHVAVYIALFTGYTVLRVIKYITTNKNIKNSN